MSRGKGDFIQICGVLVFRFFFPFCVCVCFLEQLCEEELRGGIRSFKECPFLRWFAVCVVKPNFVVVLVLVGFGYFGVLSVDVTLDK